MSTKAAPMAPNAPMDPETRVTVPGLPVLSAIAERANAPMIAQTQGTAFSPVWASGEKTIPYWALNPATIDGRKKVRLKTPNGSEKKARENSRT